MVVVTRSISIHPRTQHTLWQAGGYVALYVLLDGASYVRPVLKLGITPWNPQAGLTVAFLLAFGPRWLFATALAAFCAEGLVRDMPAAWWLLLATSAWIAAAYAILALALRRWGLQRPIDSGSKAVTLVLGAMAAGFVVAAGYVLLLVAGGALPGSMAFAAVARYWVGDVNGILTLTPLLLLWSRWRDGLRTVRGNVAVVAAQLGVLALTMWFIFGLSGAQQVRFFYLLFVPVMWITLRWGAPGAVLGVLVTQIGVIMAVQRNAQVPSLVDLQFLVLTLSVTALVLGAVISERAEALQRLAQREAEQRTLLATAPDAVLAVDRTGDISSANPAALRLFGEEAVAQAGRPLTAILPGIDLTRPDGRVSLEGLGRDGRPFPAEIAWAPLHVPARAAHLVIVRDATERRQSEIELRERERDLARAMRFAVAGELASALAHELNQPITALVSYLQATAILAAPLAGRDERLTATLLKAMQEALRASEVLHRLRDFYRGGAIKREPVNLVALCEATVANFRERLQRADIELTLHTDDSLPSMRVGVTQLEIVLHNILANAIDAVCQRSGSPRRILFAIERTADAVTVRIEDSGPGIDPEVVQKLFEPFVTSKVDGMGLGLAISRSLLRGQRGDLTYEPGHRWGGASFTVHLPYGMPTDE